MTKKEQSSASLRTLLVGGDRRSIAKSKQARRLVEQDPARIREFVESVRHPQTFVRSWALEVRARNIRARLKSQ